MTGPASAPGAVSDPASHEAHELPLAQRLTEEAIRSWLDCRTGIALAASGDLNDYERGVRQGIDQLRYLHLDNYGYTVVPAIRDSLRRAGLLTEAASSPHSVV